MNPWGLADPDIISGYETFKELEDDVKQYIEFYNTKRVTLKMGLGIPA